MTPDWQKMFVPQESLLELVIRGTIMYLGLFVVLRVLVKRHHGSLGITDLLVIVLIADAAQNGMSGEYKSITGGVVLCATIIAWSHILDWLAFRFPILRRWIEPLALELIHNGRLIRQNLRKEMLSEEELLSQLREHGVEHFKEVKRAFVEPDGQISVIRHHSSESDDAASSQRKRQV